MDAVLRPSIPSAADVNVQREPTRFCMIKIVFDNTCYVLPVKSEAESKEVGFFFFFKLIACLLVDNITFYLAYYHDLKKVKCKQIVSKPDGKWKGFGRYSWSTQRDHVSMLTTGCNQLDTGKTGETSTYR